MNACLSEDAQIQVSQESVHMMSLLACLGSIVETEKKVLHVAERSRQDNSTPEVALTLLFS